MAFGDGNMDSNNFIPLQTSEASGSFEINTSTPCSIPFSNTHDTSRAKYHMKDLSSFAADVENSVKRAFPNTGGFGSRYKSVHVLLLRWEHDEMGVNCELEGLNKVFASYGFGTEIWLIPSDNSHLKLTLKAASFVEEHEHEGNLLVVYYGGHAAINSARQSTWYCKGDPEFASVSLEWSAIQTVFERAVSDVVLLLDCCHAASAAPQAGRAMTEIIAACGWEAIAPLPGPWSFTTALIEVLEEWIEFSFSVAMLHSKVLSVLKHGKPEQRGSKKRKIECRRTPVYILATADPSKPSINFSKLKSRNSVQTAQTTYASGVNFTSQNPSSGKVAKTLPNPYNSEELISHTPTGDLKVPHVIVSLALENDQDLDAKACSTWLASFPALARYASVKAVYKGYSVLILISMPVLVWDLLPRNPACSFIGYVTSENLLDHHKSKDEVSTQGAHEQMQGLQATDLPQIVASWECFGENESEPSDFNDPVAVSVGVGHFHQYSAGAYGTLWKCCKDGREVSHSVWENRCPDCGHEKCTSCTDPYPW